MTRPATATSPIQPGVSVVIPAYNAARSLARTIETALAQTVPPLEVIVVDDGSSDSTADVAEAFGPPVQVIRKPNGGPASARNIGVQRSRGEWIALLDADDQWTPDKLERQLRHVGRPDVGLVHALTSFQRIMPPEALTFEQLWTRNWIVNSTVLVRREAFLSLGGFNEARELISVEDYNLWVRLAASKWKILLCPEPLTHYTRGVGISSDTPRFFKASLYNVVALGNALGLPRRVVDDKLASIHLDFGMGALYRRNMPEARRLLLRSMRLKPKPRSLAMLAIACCPARLLDFKRYGTRLFNRRRMVAAAGAASEAEAMLDLVVDDVFAAGDPEETKALFRALAMLGIRADLVAAHNQGEILSTVRRLAWLGYNAPADLRRQLRLREGTANPRDEATQRVNAALGLAAGQAFLPLVSTLAWRAAPPRPMLLGVDALSAGFRRSGLASRMSGQAATDERVPLAYYLAALIHRRRSLTPVSAGQVTGAEVAAVLRGICTDGGEVLADLRAASDDPDALHLCALAEDISATSPYLWFEALRLADALEREARSSGVVPDADVRQPITTRL